MRKLNNKPFANCFTRYMQAVTKSTDGDVIAIDGKNLELEKKLLMKIMPFSGILHSILFIVIRLLTRVYNLKGI